MNDTEINATAQGILMYLRQQCGDPLDALAVIICLFLIYYEQQRRDDFTIEEYVEKIGRDIIKFWNMRTKPTAEGMETIQ